MLFLFCRFKGKIYGVILNYDIMKKVIELEIKILNNKIEELKNKLNDIGRSL